MKTNKKAITSKDAWEIQECYKEQAHSWIQWKGTEVCMDTFCKCGETFHIDAGYCYNIECPYCGTIYMCNGHIELIELEIKPDCCITGEK